MNIEFQALADSSSAIDFYPVAGSYPISGTGISGAGLSGTSISGATLSGAEDSGSEASSSELLHHSLSPLPVSPSGVSPFGHESLGTGSFLLRDGHSLAESRFLGESNMLNEGPLSLPLSIGMDITVAFLTLLYIAHLLVQLRSKAEPLFSRVDGSFLQARKRCLVDQKVCHRAL